MRKTFDTYRDEPEVYIRFTDRVHPRDANSRRKIQDVWQAFDDFCLSEQQFIKSIGYGVGFEDFGWFTTGPHGPHQQSNMMPITIENENERGEFIRKLYAHGYEPW